MTAKNFVNFHVLISHSPSCLNRDDMNMQKTAVFGGRSRVRISSQSLKRPLRMSDYYKAHFGMPSVRTRNLEALKQQYSELLKDEFEPGLVSSTMELFVRAKKGDDETSDADVLGDATDDENESKKLAVAPWVLQEIRVLCGIAKTISLTEEEKAKAREKASKQKGKKQKAEQFFVDDAFNRKLAKAVEARASEVGVALGSAMDVALSGRMATSGLMTSVDGSLAVAHAITTHAVEPQDVDWFTAVDDLTQDAGETGAGHLDTQQFSSGVFYRYASLNLKQLQVNLGLLPAMDAPETAASRRRTLEIAGHALHMLATVVPAAKQQSFAAHNLADLALVSFSDIPVSLSNAFETPVPQAREGGFLVPSIDVLADYWAKTHAFYGIDENAAVASVRTFACPKQLMQQSSLADLERWIENDGKA